MNERAFSPTTNSTEPEGRYPTYGLLPDPPSLAMPVPMLGYQPEFEFMFPLLPTTPFFAHPPQRSGTVVNELSSQYYSPPPEEQRAMIGNSSTLEAPQEAAPYYASEFAISGDSERYPTPIQHKDTPTNHCDSCDFFSHTIPPMASEDVSMRGNYQQHQITTPVQQIPRGGGKQQASTSSNYICSICGRTFQRQSSLSQHTTVAHNGIRPFGCEFPGCAKRFTTSSNAKRHSKTHLA